MNTIIICPCGKEIPVPPHRLGRKKYCSRECLYKYHKRPSGLKYKLTKENIGQFKKGNIPWSKNNPGYSTSKKGKKYPNIIPWNKGTMGICKPNSSSFKKGEHTGENHPNWQGGNKEYGIEFDKQLKEQIRERDNYRCQECFKHEDELHDKKGRKYKLMVHHIDYDKKNNNPSNLIALCRNCHLKTNFSRDDWTNHFNKII